MPTVNPSPFGPKPQFLDAAGNPDLGYKMFFYVAGSTSTKQNTYTNSTGSVANTNPIILNALGQTPNELWWDTSLIYKVVLAPATDTDPPTNPVWTIDNLQGMNNGSGSSALSQWVLYSASAIAFVNSTTFTVVGNQTLTFQPGRRLQFITTGGTVYGSILTSTFSSVTTVTMLMDGTQVLDSGLSKVYYSILTSTNMAIPTGIIPIKSAVAANSASIDFTDISSDIYDYYFIEYASALPQNNGDTLSFRVFVGGVIQTSAVYQHANQSYNSGSGNFGGATGSTVIYLSPVNGVSNIAAGGGVSGSLTFSGASSTTNNKNLQHQGNFFGTSSSFIGVQGFGVVSIPSSAVSGFRIFYGGGNIVSGTFTLYGLRKAL